MFDENEVTAEQNRTAASIFVFHNWLKSRVEVKKDLPKYWENLLKSEETKFWLNDLYEHVFVLEDLNHFGDDKALKVLAGVKALLDGELKIEIKNSKNKDLFNELINHLDMMGQDKDVKLDNMWLIKKNKKRFIVWIKTLMKDELFKEIGIIKNVDRKGKKIKDSNNTYMEEQVKEINYFLDRLKEVELNKSNENLKDKNNAEINSCKEIKQENNNSKNKKKSKKKKGVKNERVVEEIKEDKNIVNMEGEEVGNKNEEDNKEEVNKINIEHQEEERVQRNNEEKYSEEKEKSIEWNKEERRNNEEESKIEENCERKKKKEEEERKTGRNNKDRKKDEEEKKTGRNNEENNDDEEKKIEANKEVKKNNVEEEMRIEGNNEVNKKEEEDERKTDGNNEVKKDEEEEEKKIELNKEEKKTDQEKERRTQGVNEEKKGEKEEGKIEMNNEANSVKNNVKDKKTRRKNKSRKTKSNNPKKTVVKDKELLINAENETNKNKEIINSKNEESDYLLPDSEDDELGFANSNKNIENSLPNIQTELLDDTNKELNLNKNTGDSLLKLLTP
uniref:Uncharacterized protein n=1 Tax=Meloidogyne javanica TaxID=6303 RepID=A0A915LS32_MELJA